MTPEISQFVTTAVGIFVGSLPLLGVIGWSAYTQDKRLSRIEANLDELGKDLKAIDVRAGGLETRVTVIQSDSSDPNYSDGYFT